MKGGNTSETANPGLKAELGEDPERFLDRPLSYDDQWPMARITGIDHWDTSDLVAVLEALEEQEEPKIVTDGGRDVSRRDPSDDPTLCSLCGVYIGAFPDKEYCDGCAREVGLKPPLVRCMHCGDEGPEEYMESIDISADDEYYPEFEYLCPSCAGDSDA